MQLASLRRWFGLPLLSLSFFLLRPFVAQLHACKGGWAFALVQGVLQKSPGRNIFLFLRDLHRKLALASYSHAPVGGRGFMPKSSTHVAKTTKMVNCGVGDSGAARLCCCARDFRELRWLRSIYIEVNSTGRRSFEPWLPTILDATHLIERSEGSSRLRNPTRGHQGLACSHSHFSKFSTALSSRKSMVALR